MSITSRKTAEAGPCGTADVEPILSSKSQQELDEALDETPSTEDLKRAWVEENRRDLERAFEAGRKVDMVAPGGGVEFFTAVEGTVEDLRHILVGVTVIELGNCGVNGTDARFRE